MNDVWGLRGDPAMVDVLAAHPHVALVAMHNQRGTDYGDLMEDICGALRESVRLAQAHGVGPAASSSIQVSGSARHPRRTSN